MLALLPRATVLPASVPILTFAPNPVAFMEPYPTLARTPNPIEETLRISVP